MKMSFNLQP